MRVVKRKSRKEHRCNYNGCPYENLIEPNSTYVVTTAIVNKSNSDGYYWITNHWHLGCFIAWFMVYERQRIRKEPRSYKSKPRGGHPIILDSNIDDSGEINHTYLTEEQKTRRKQLTGMYHYLIKGGSSRTHTIDSIIKEMSELGGVPAKWNIR